MSFARYLRDICQDQGDPGGLMEDDAYRLFGAMLDGGIPELELGALLAALRLKQESVAELFGFSRAVSERLYLLDPPPGSVRPVVLSSYDGTRNYPNLVPLLALLLQRFGIPVLVHGTLEGCGGLTSAHVFRELNTYPCTSLSQAQRALQNEGLAFAPCAVLSPGLAALLSLRARLGVDNVAHTMVRLLAPFGGEGFRVVGARSDRERDTLRDFLLGSGAHGLLLDVTEGEPFANPDRRPKLEYVAEGEAALLFETEAGPVKGLSHLPNPMDALNTARWVRQALAGEVPVPMPIVNQVACCLYGAGYTDDMNQAKAIVAVETRSLAGA